MHSDFVLYRRKWPYNATYAKNTISWSANRNITLKSHGLVEIGNLECSEVEFKLANAHCSLLNQAPGNLALDIVYKTVILSLTICISN